MSFQSTTTTPIEALRARGVAAHVARRLAAEQTPDLIGAWCAYAKRHPKMPVGTVVNGVRSGEHPPGARTPDLPPSTWEIERWLAAKLPEVCDEDGHPHDAAVLAVRRIHFRHGRGSITVRAHGAVIRAAVVAARKSEQQEGEQR